MPVGGGQCSRGVTPTFPRGLSQQKIFTQAQQTVNQNTAPNKTEILLARALLVIDRGRLMKYSALLALIKVPYF